MTRITSNPAWSEEVGEDLPEPLPQLHEMMNDAFQAYPDNLAVVSMHQLADLYAFAYSDPCPENGQYLRWTQRMLNQATRKLVASLQYQGVCKGDTITTIIPNGVEWLLIVYASIMLGATIAPMSPRTLVNTVEAIHMLQTVKAKVIVASNAEVASTVDKILQTAPVDLKLKVQVDVQGCASGWKTFPSVLENLGNKIISNTVSKHDVKDLCIVAFTSGTTSLPKGCPLTNRAIAQTIHGAKKRLNLDQTSAICSIMPNNHLMAYFHLISYPSVGGKIVFPAPAFEARAVRSAFEKEQCTNLVCVPTMLHALMDSTPGGSKKLRNVRQIDIGGAAVTPRHLRQCVHDLGAKSVGTTFGMTEGAPVRAIGASNPEVLIKGESVVAGRPIPGARVRICDPETRRMVKRGEYGELHQSGGQTIDQYLGLGKTKEFYNDEDGVEWFCSGDQAVMDDNGDICIVGRYKDMIIRGGENIAPATIERVLNDSEAIELAQVVAYKDDIAGEIPVAVYQARAPISVKSMQDSVLRSLGHIYVPGDFVNLRDLGLEEFPKTVSGKIQKTELVPLVRDFMHRKHAPVTNGNLGSMKDHVLRIWASLLAIPAENFDLESSVDDFADSITVMRFRDKVRKQLGRNISLEQMAANTTIAAQIYLLENASMSNAERSDAFVKERSGPPTALDIIHVSGGDASIEETRISVEQAICPLGFTWEHDVEDVMPAYDYAGVQFTQQRAISHNRRHAQVTLSHDVKALKVALRAVLSNHSVLRSFFIRQNKGKSNEIPLYVTMRANDRWFDRAIVEGGTVKTLEDLKHFAAEDTTLDHSYPGPLFRASIFHVVETCTAGFAWNGNHVTFDAMAIRLFTDDLEKALQSQGATLDQHIPYKFWADTYYSLRGSLSAEEGVKWHVQRLAHLREHRKALFPAQRAPMWFLGPTRGWSPTEKDKKNFPNPNRDCISKPSSYESNGITWHGELPSVKKLRTAVPGLTGPPIVKAALAMMNVYFTQHSHAIFTCVEGGRSSLPLVPDHLASHLDHINCADVSGPCFAFVADIIEVKPDEPVSNFLARLQVEQNGLTKYAHAPLRKIVKALGTNAEGSGSGDMVLELFRRQLFNWAPGVGNAGKSPYEQFRSLLGSSQSDNGIVFNAGLGGQDGTACTLSARWDDANTTREEAERMMQTLAKILTWITEGGDWSRPVGKFVECL